MKIVNTEQMRRIDEITIRERGIAGIELMERAGREVAREVLERFSPAGVAIVAGKGNNGGDGFVAARHLHESGVHVALFLSDDPAMLKGDAKTAFDNMPSEIPVEVVGDAELSTDSDSKFAARLRDFEVVIDALFGTGIRGEVKGRAAKIIEAVNAAQNAVVSIDLPSGLSADGGPHVGPCVRAAVTITIGLPKIGLVTDPGIRTSGIISIADIGFPNDLLNDPAITTSLMELDDARALLPTRDPSGHKGTFGKTLIIAGSEGMTGAAVLASRAASRSGVGLVYAAYPRPLGAILETLLIEPVKVPLAGDSAHFIRGHLAEAMRAADGMDSMALGPGIGQRQETGEFVLEVIRKTNAPLVLDADALNILSAEADPTGVLKSRNAPTILTPHPAEAARLLKTTTEKIQADRLNAMLDFARESNAVILLKGAQSVVTSPSGERSINPTGNSGLAKGGSGDVLTGILAGLLAQGLSTWDAARLGVFLHGLAADHAARKLGIRAMLPSDVIKFLGDAFRAIERTENG